MKQTAFTTENERKNEGWKKDTKTIKRKGKAITKNY